MKGAQKYEPAIWEKAAVAFALSQFCGLDYLGAWNSRYSESIFLSEEVKTMLYLNSVKSFDVTEVRVLDYSILFSFVKLVTVF